MNLWRIVMRCLNLANKNEVTIELINETHFNILVVLDLRTCQQDEIVKYLNFSEGRKTNLIACSDYINVNGVKDRGVLTFIEVINYLNSIQGAISFRNMNNLTLITMLVKIS